MLANEKQISAVLGSFQENTQLWSTLKGRLCVDEKRVNVLQEIAAGVTSWESEKLRNEIYLYGSMLKGSDLLGRQIFLLYRKFLKSSEIVYNALEIKNDITKERRGLRHDVVYEVFCFGLGDCTI